MTPLDKGPEIFSFLVRSTKFENGAFLLLGAAISDPYTKILKMLVTDIHPKEFVLPIIVAGVSIILYVIVAFLDFIYGVRAAKHESETGKNYIRSDKLWSSVYKLTAVFFLIFVVFIFSLMFALLEVNVLQKFFMYATAAIAFMSILFDMHSIGENHKRRFGKKPAIFDWLDNMAKVLNEEIIQRIKSIGR